MPIRFSITPRLLTLALGAFAVLLAAVFMIGMRVGQAIQIASSTTNASPGARPPAVIPPVTPPVVAPPVISPPVIAPPMVTPPQAPMAPSQPSGR